MILHFCVCTNVLFKQCLIFCPVYFNCHFHFITITLFRTKACIKRLGFEKVDKTKVGKVGNAVTRYSFWSTYQHRMWCLLQWRNHRNHQGMAICYRHLLLSKNCKPLIRQPWQSYWMKYLFQLSCGKRMMATTNFGFGMIKMKMCWGTKSFQIRSWSSIALIYQIWEKLVVGKKVDSEHTTYFFV